jgi:hypothetical protein
MLDANLSSQAMRKTAIPLPKLKTTSFLNA